MIRTLLISFFIFTFLSTSLWSQAREEPEEGNYYWLGISSGIGNGVSSALSLNGEVSHFTLGIEYRENYFGEPFNFFGPPEASSRGLNILGGKLFKFNPWLIHLSLGAGYAYQRVPYKVGETGGWLSTGVYEYEKSSTMGVVVSAEIAVEIDMYKLGFLTGLAMAGDNHVVFFGANLGFGKFF